MSGVIERAYSHTLPLQPYEPDMLSFELVKTSKKAAKTGCQWLDGEPIFTPQFDTVISSESGFHNPAGLQWVTLVNRSFGGTHTVGNIDHDGIRGAVRRLTAKREPEIDGAHEELFYNQARAGDHLGELYTQWRSTIKERYRQRMSQANEAYLEKLAWASAPHVKRKLRVRTALALHNRSDDRSNLIKRADYKAKSGELLARGKHLRAVADLTATGASVGGYLFDRLKDSFRESYHTGQSECEFIKVPSKPLLSNTFKKLADQPGVYFSYFSDDSCIGADCSDGRFMANLDIKACDGSNGPFVFDTLREIMSGESRYQSDVDGVFNQLRLPFRVRDPQDRHRYFDILPHRDVLYSGSVATTSCNNVSNSLIFLSIVKGYSKSMSKDELSAHIVAAARSVGFIVKMQVCEELEDLQFLKHSCSFVDGLYVPWLNLGTMLKSSGVCFGKLVPGKGNLYNRIRMYNSDAVLSRVHSGDHVINDAFKVDLIPSRKTGQFQPKTFDDSGFNWPRVPDESLCRRYKICPLQLQELAHFIRTSGITAKINCPASRAILGLDYGF